MSRLGDTLRGQAAAREQGVSEWCPTQSSFESNGRGVQASPELARILALPRRPAFSDDENYDETVEAVSGLYRRPAVAASAATPLWPIQAFALAEAARVGGLFLAAGVGRGKTLTSLLLPRALGSKCALLLVPHSVRRQLLDVEYPKFAADWALPEFGVSLHVYSYEDWSSKKRGRTLLTDLQPDLIIADEAQYLSRSGTTRYRRLREYVRANPSTRFCFLTGSPVRDSIKDYAHLLALALRNGSPLPRDWAALEEWSHALDAAPRDGRLAPGALARLVPPSTPPSPVPPDYDAVASGYQCRLAETPGVVITTQALLKTRIVIRRKDVKLPPIIHETLRTLRNTWTLPDGEELCDAIEFYAAARQLASGFYYVCNPKPLDYWLEARADWNREIRETLKRPKAGLDSPGLITEAHERGQMKSPFYDNWVAVKNACHPKTEPVWMSNFLITDAVEWGYRAPGLIWVEHVAVGEAIAEAGGFPYYGQDGGDITFEDGTRTVVASRPSVGRGLNLQRFHRQLFTGVASSGQAWQQALGRTYRHGQIAEAIETFVYQHTPEVRKAFSDALGDAKFALKTLNQAQLLLYADVDLRGSDVQTY